MCPSHILTGFGSFFLGYSHDVSPFSGNARSRATVLFSGYLEILQRAKRKADCFFAARTAGGV